MVKFSKLCEISPNFFEKFIFDCGFSASNLDPPILHALRDLYVGKGEVKIKNKLARFLGCNFFQTSEDLSVFIKNKSLKVQNFENYKSKINGIAKLHNLILSNEKGHIFIVTDDPTSIARDPDNPNIFIALAKRSVIIESFHKYYDKEILEFALNNRSNSAKNLKTGRLGLYSLCVLAAVITFSLSFTLGALITILVTNLIYTAGYFYRFYFTLSGLSSTIAAQFIAITDLESIPLYSILLPIYKEESETIRQLIESLNALDYPKHLLDIKILVEENDFKIRSFLKTFELPYYFDLIVVKSSIPQTKPKACNFALPFVLGEFLTIYDAEDVPEVDQLKQVIKTFLSNPKLQSIQCNLVIYNQNENFLSKFYAWEFALWYEALQKGFKKNGLPVTFGGSSNHFHTHQLLDTSWDSFNVTEDAELGLQYWQHNHSIELVEAKTFEEGPINIKVWIRQRTRWIKGFLQTYMMALKYRQKTRFNNKLTYFLWLNLFMIAPTISHISLLWMIPAFLSLAKHAAILKKIQILTMLNWLISYALIVIKLLIFRAKKRSKENPQYFRSFFFPLYLQLCIVSSFRAVFQFFTNQSMWEKTPHALTKVSQKNTRSSSGLQ